MLTAHKEQQERSAVQNKQKAQPWKAWPEVQDTINSKGSLDTAEAQTSRRKISQKKLPRRKWSKTEIENENAE